MTKCILFGLALLCLAATPLEASRCCWGQKHCWGCRRYMDPTYAGYEGLYYGYVDNINYPDPYALPYTYHFNCRPSCGSNCFNGPHSQHSYHYTNKYSIRRYCHKNCWE